MKLKAIKNCTILLSLATFIISLTQDAVTIDYLEEEKVSSLTYFLMGSTAFLGGGLLEQIIWFANPLSLFSIILLVKNNQQAITYSCIALILAVSFSSWNEILGSESGSMAKIVSLEAGYYLWISSITILTIGIYFYFKIEKKNKSNA